MLTVMIITLAGPFSGERVALPFSGARACSDAMPVISAMLDTEMIQCRRTLAPAVSLRPMKRPEEE